MRVTAECIPCYLQQCLKAMEQQDLSNEEKEEMLLRLFPVIAGLDRALTPAENSSIVMHHLVGYMGGSDLFEAAKRESNEKALQLMGKLQKEVDGSRDPVKQAVKFSVAGNVVDLGLFDEYDLDAALKEVIRTGFARDDYDRFNELLSKARKVLIIGDNSGEIVFDRLMVEALKSKGIDVVYGVKGSFIINDATVKDAQQAGLDQICKVITNGNNYLGTIEKQCSQEFLEEFKKSDIVVSKGKANYESLEGTELAGDKTFFLLKAKCPVVAGYLGVSCGAVVFVRNTVAKNLRE